NRLRRLTTCPQRARVGREVACSGTARSSSFTYPQLDFRRRTMDEILMLYGGGAGMVSFLARVTGIDASAMVRLRQLSDGSAGQPPLIDVFATKPFEVVATRRLRGTVSGSGAWVGANTMRTDRSATYLASATGKARRTLTLGPPRD